jgi:hypothetical protein
VCWRSINNRYHNNTRMLTYDTLIISEGDFKLCSSHYAKTSYPPATSCLLDQHFILKHIPCTLFPQGDRPSFTPLQNNKWTYSLLIFFILYIFRPGDRKSFWTKWYQAFPEFNLLPPTLCIFNYNTWKYITFRKQTTCRYRVQFAYYNYSRHTGDSQYTNTDVWVSYQRSVSPAKWCSRTCGRQWSCVNNWDHEYHIYNWMGR